MVNGHDKFPSGAVGCVTMIANAWVDITPLGEEILVSKLSATTWTKPGSHVLITIKFASLCAAIAADVLNRFTSS